MLNNSIRVLNFDDSILKQKKILTRYKFEILDLKGIGPIARNWVNLKTRGIIEGRIKNSAKNSVTFLGSGDYHHISEILISRFNEPISIIDFDFHPDWVLLPPRFGCGSWVNEVLRKKNILKFIMLGVSSADLSSPDIQTGNLGLLKDDRVEIYPYEHKPSLAFFKIIPKNISLTVKNGIVFNRIYWSELKDKNLNDFFYELLKRIAQKKVYVSIDKDCLKNDYALTNWEEGKFSLDELLLLLKLIKENLDIVGLDISGDYSPVSVKGVIKKIASYLDHPKKIKAATLPEPIVTSINEETNLKILEALNF